MIQSMVWRVPSYNHNNDYDENVFKQLVERLHKGYRGTPSEKKQKNKLCVPISSPPANCGASSVCILVKCRYG